MQGAQGFYCVDFIWFFMVHTHNPLKNIIKIDRGAVRAVGKSAALFRGQVSGAGWDSAPRYDLRLTAAGVIEQGGSGYEITVDQDMKKHHGPIPDPVIGPARSAIAWVVCSGRGRGHEKARAAPPSFFIYFLWRVGAAMRFCAAEPRDASSMSLLPHACFSFIFNCMI